jgi:hypothetical protein
VKSAGGLATTSPSRCTATTPSPSAVARSPQPTSAPPAGCSRAERGLVELQVRPVDRGVEEIDDRRLHHQMRQPRATEVIRVHDAVGAGLENPPFCAFLGRARHDEQIGVQRARRQHGVDVVRVVAQTGHQPTRVLLRWQTAVSPPAYTPQIVPQLPFHD